MNKQEQLANAKAEVARLEAEIAAEPQIKRGTIVWAWNDGEVLTPKRIKVYIHPEPIGEHLCGGSAGVTENCNDIHLFDHVEPITMPPSKDILKKAYWEGSDAMRESAASNGATRPNVDAWIKENYPEAI